jgi:hypothetical protein
MGHVDAVPENSFRQLVGSQKRCLAGTDKRARVELAKQNEFHSHSPHVVHLGRQGAGWFVEATDQENPLS